MFVDESGRRSQKFRRLGWVLAIGCACYAIALVTALLGGNSSAPWLPGINQSDDKKSEKVEIQPAPSDSVSAVATPGATPGAPAPTDSTGALLPLQPSGSASSGATGGVPVVPGAGPSGSASPKPSTGGGAPVTGGQPSPSASPGGSDPDPVPETSPDPSPSATPPSDVPTPPQVQEGA